MTSGWTIAGMPRQTTFRAETVKPLARRRPTVSRLQRQPPAKLRHGSTSFVLARRQKS
ncbi:hypothetical protein [Mycolicibacterium sp. XJ1904]